MDEKSQDQKCLRRGYEEFVLSELARALMENDHQSVRGLAQKAGLSPTVIQDIRSGKQEDMKVRNFISIAHACGYHVFLANERKKSPWGNRRVQILVRGLISQPFLRGRVNKINQGHSHPTILNDT